MKLTIFFLQNKIFCINLTVNGEEHCAFDNRVTAGEPTEVCICLSKSSKRGNSGYDVDSDTERLIEEGLMEKREIEIENPEIEWHPYGISYVLVNHPKLKF